MRILNADDEGAHLEVHEYDDGFQITSGCGGVGFSRDAARRVGVALLRALRLGPCRYCDGTGEHLPPCADPDCSDATCQLKGDRTRRLMAADESKDIIAECPLCDRHLRFSVGATTVCACGAAVRLSSPSFEDTHARLGDEDGA